MKKWKFQDATNSSLIGCSCENGKNAKPDISITETLYLIPVGQNFYAANIN